MQEREGMGMRQVDHTGAVVDASAVGSLQLSIYVTRHCAVCQYALELAAYIREHYAHVELRIVELETTTEPIPDSVFATPTYLLNGRVWSLGNPSFRQIEDALCPQTASLLNNGA